MALTDDDLTPLQYLLMEALTARWRLGEPFWPFPKRFKRTLDQLQRLGLLNYEHHSVPDTYRAWITQAGRDMFLSPDYTLPADR